jgi:tetratricopeptide (TPR) repeat protein
MKIEACPNPKWRDPPSLAAFSDAISALGFAPAGAYWFPGKVDSMVALFVNEIWSMFSQYHEEDGVLPISFTMESVYSDGESLVDTYHHASSARISESLQALIPQHLSDRVKRRRGCKIISLDAQDIVARWNRDWKAPKLTPDDDGKDLLRQFINATTEEGRHLSSVHGATILFALVGMSAESKSLLLRHRGASFVLMFAERSADEKRRLLETPGAEVFFEEQFVEHMRRCAGQFRAAGEPRTAALFLWLAGLFESCREDAYASVLAGSTERMSRLSGLLQEFVEARHEVKRRLLKADSGALLDPAIELEMRQRAEHVQDQEVRDYFETLADLLADCRGAGVDAVFALRDREHGALFLPEDEPRLRDWAQVLQHRGPEWRQVQANALKIAEAIAEGSAGERRMVFVQPRGLPERTGELVRQIMAGDLPKLGQLLQTERDLLIDSKTEMAPRQWAEQARERGDPELATMLSSVADLLVRYRRRPAEELLALSAIESAGVATYRDLVRELLYRVNRGSQNIDDFYDRKSLEHEVDLAHRGLLFSGLVDPGMASPGLRASFQYHLAGNLARLGQLKGDHELVSEAIHEYRSALELWPRDVESLTPLRIRKGLGTALLLSGEINSDGSLTEQAVAEFEQLLRSFERDNLADERAEVRSLLAIALLSLGRRSANPRYDEAIDLFRSALGESSTEGSEATRTMIELNLSSTLADAAKLKGRQDLAAQAVGLGRQLLAASERNRRRVMTTHGRRVWAKVLATAAGLQNDAALETEALNALRDAFDALESTGWEDKRQEIARSLSELLLRRERYDEATSVIERALTGVEAAIEDPLRSRSARTRSVGQVSGLHDTLSLCRFKLGHGVDAAMESAAAGRARLMADALGLAEHRIEELPTQVRDQITAARERWMDLRDAIGVLPPGPHLGVVPGFVFRRQRFEAESGLLDGQWEDARREHDRYLALCREHGLVRSSEQIRADDIRSAAPPFGALVLPVLTPTESFAAVIANGKAELIELPNLNVSMVVARLAHAGGLTPEWMWKVVGPIHEYLKSAISGKLAKYASVVFVPPGLLGLLPLSAARSEQNEYFGDYWTVSFAPSVQALQRSRERSAKRRKSPAKLLAIIDPRRKLPAAQLEKAVLLERFAHAESVILEFEDATVRSVLKHLSTATHIHIAAHASTDPRFAERSSIQLADGELTVEMLRQYRLEGAQLVFLSACESALAGVVAPDEHIGFPAALLEAGAACVIGALWPVPDLASAVLARGFYQFHLGEGGVELAPPADALRAAQAWLREVTIKQLRPTLPDRFRNDTGDCILSSSVQSKIIGEVVEPSSPRGSPQSSGEMQPFAAVGTWSVWTATGWPGSAEKH